MKLKKLAICNYRSFGERVEIPIDDITTFIGDNSAGKSSALSALNCLFSPFSKERIITRRDFHIPPMVDLNSINELNLYIEAFFSFDEIETANENADAIAVFFQQFSVENEEGNLELRIRLEAKWSKTLNVDGDVEIHYYYIKSLEETYDPSLVTKADSRNISKIRTIYIPAVRDPLVLLKNATNNMLGRLIQSINWQNSLLEGIKTKVKELSDNLSENNGIKWIVESIKNQWMSYNVDQRYANADFSFENLDIDSIMKNAGVMFSSETSSEKINTNELGDGLRSLFYISIIDSVLSVEEKIRQEGLSGVGENDKTFSQEVPLLTIIALEEPENHVSPHILGKLINNLLRVAGLTNAQVILTSHSSSIVKRVKPESLKYFHLKDISMETEVKEISFPPKESEKHKFVKEAVTAYPELYFSKLVILGEGQSEEIILPKLWFANYKTLDESSVSVVPLGGVCVNHFWRLLEGLNIKYVTLLDFDNERCGGGWGRIKYALDQLMEYGRISKNDIKDFEGNIIDPKEMLNESEWLPTDKDKINYWIDFLEKYDVFFSSPLDIDFLMLKQYSDIYKGLAPTNGGPKISFDENGTKKQKNVKDEELINPPSAEYLSRMGEDIHATLKKEGGDGSSYSEEEKKLMIWYVYSFLNRAKPATHIEAITQIVNQGLENNAPDVLKRMLQRAQDKLGR